MEDREENRMQRECREDAENLLMWAAAYDKPPHQKPGEFFNRIKHRIQHPEKLKAAHFPHYLGKS